MKFWRPRMCDTPKIPGISEQYVLDKNQSNISALKGLSAWLTFLCALLVMSMPAHAQIDTDADGVFDSDDNCINTPNPAQVDADGDGIGSFCDADYSNDCIVNFIDLGTLRLSFFQVDPLVDLNGDGDINFLDLGIFRTLFLQPPGPSGVPNICAPDVDTDMDGLSDGDELLIWGTDPSNPDTDQDGLTDGEEVALGSQPLDDDSDDDGVLDGQDSYPLDLTQFQLGPVSAIATDLNTSFVEVTWQAHPDPAVTAGYLVYRESLSDGMITLLTDPALPTIDLSYDDLTVVNGEGYRYVVVAVDARANEGEYAAYVDQFVAFNPFAVLDLQVTQGGVNPTLTFFADDGIENFRIYRGQNGDYVPIADVSGENYTDTSVTLGETYDYQVVTLIEFTNPFDSSVVQIEGPVGDAVTYVPDPIVAFEINIVNAITTAPQTYELLVINDSTAEVIGAYAGDQEIALTAQAGGELITGVGSSGEFRLFLPISTPGPWTITATEQGGAAQTDAVTVTLIFDVSPPVVMIDNNVLGVTNSDNIEVFGVVTDDVSGVASVQIVNDRYEGSTFSALIEQDSEFSASVPLERGSNLISVSASDVAGNTSGAAQITVTRSVGQIPDIIITEPLNGSSVTETSVTVSGVVYTSLPEDEVRLLLGSDLTFPVAGGADDEYEFTFPAVTLTPGANLLTVRAETIAGNAQKSVTVTYDDGQSIPEPDPDPPVLALDVAGNQLVVNDDAFILSGSAFGNDVSITIDGNDVDLVSGRFQFNLDLSACVNQLVVNVVATDSNSQSVSQTLTLICDATPPAIAVTTPVLNSPPAVNTVVATPIQLTGTITESNLAGFTINGQEVGLLPSGDGTSFNFDTNISLSAGVEESISLVAWDAGGSSTSVDYLLLLDVPVSITVLSPASGSTIETDDSSVTIEVVARVEGLTVNDSVYLSIDGGSELLMNLSGDVASATTTPGLTVGQHTLTVIVRDDQGTLIASAATDVSVGTTQDDPLTVVRTEPVNQSSGNAPNDAVTIYFNQSIDPSLIEIQLTQTVHGRDYDLTSQQGAGFTELKQPKLMQVDMDREPVSGGLAFYPDNKFLSFHPDETLAYGAEIFVDVIYDGNSLTRFVYTVQELPTIIGGLVADQFATPLENIRVEIPELNLAGVTDNNGNYVFGSGSEFSEALPGGRYRLIANPNQLNPRYGVIEVWTSVQEGRLNNPSTVRIPLLDSELPYKNIGPGDTNLSLMGGDLLMDLSEATVTFANGRNQGIIHTQFMPANQISFESIPGAIPFWLYAIQPSGISVSGDVGLSIKLPPLFGSFDYAPPEGSLVAIVGFDVDRKVIKTIGVGEVNNLRVDTVAKVPLTSLDYIGFAFAVVEAQPLLEQFRDGQITSLEILQTLLEQAYRESATENNDGP